MQQTAEQIKPGATIKEAVAAQDIDLVCVLGFAFDAQAADVTEADGVTVETSRTGFAEVADERGVSPQQVALAWELAQSEVVIPIPGAKRPQSITNSAAAAEIDLTDRELERLDAS